RKYLAPEFGVFRSCKALEISVSTYYYHSDARTKKAKADKEILLAIEEIIEKLPQSGYRPVTIILNRTNAVATIGKKKVARIMRENGLKCRRKATFHTVTTNSKHSLEKYQN